MIDPGDTKGAVVWFTGLSGAGKTTIARALAARLATQSTRLELLDGDVLRDVMPTGFSREERDAHVRRIGWFASRLEHHGVIVLASLVSPYREARATARGFCRTFIEVHVATPLEECERRDVKGLYARARRGEIKAFTGIDDPYEPPLTPELVIDTTKVSENDAVTSVIEALRQRIGL